MSQLVYTIIGGVITAIIVAWFGIGSRSRVVVHGIKIRRSGKWIVFFSVIAIISGLAWAGSNSTNPAYGYTLAGYGALAYIVGRIIAWFQKL